MKVISFGTQCDTDIILSLLEKAVNDGHWLVFNNCHLLEQWDDKVVAHLSQLTSLFRGRWLDKNPFQLNLDNYFSLFYFFTYHTEEQCVIHPSFRLWFTTQEQTSCVIPGSSIKLPLLLYLILCFQDLSL